MNEVYLNIIQLCQSIRELRPYIAAHDNTFGLVIDTIALFQDDLSTNFRHIEFDNTGSERFLEIPVHLRKLSDLIIRFQRHNWARPTIEQPISSVADEIEAIFTSIHNCVSTFSKTLANAVVIPKEKMEECRVSDLIKVKISFEDHLTKGNTKEEEYALIQSRITSIEGFLREKGGTATKDVPILPIHYQSWLMKYEDLEFHKEIGNGGTACVFRGYDRRTGNEIAIKKLKKQGRDMNTSAPRRAFMREVEVLATNLHPTLLKFVGATVSPDFCIVTEWMSGGSLFEDLTKNHRLDKTQLSIAIYDIARGMRFLHSRKIMHRDLKSLNVLVDDKGYCRISDFGFSRHETQTEHMTRNIGTPNWMAPELLSTSGVYNLKIDVYSYAMVLAEILNGDVPFRHLSAEQICAQVRHNDLRPSLPNDTPSAMSELVKQCWDRDPNVRPTFEEIVSRLRQEVIILPGADRDKFLQHVRRSFEQDNEGEESLPLTLQKDTLAFLNMTHKDKSISTDQVDFWWSVLQKSANQPDEVKGEAAVKFFDTPYSQQAIDYIAALKRNSVRSDAIRSLFTQKRPVDDTLVIAACKNGAADIALIHAVTPYQTKLSLEVAAYTGVSNTLRTAVADKCVQRLKDSDTSIVCAAIRCLIKIEEVKRVPQNVIESHMTSKNEGLRNCIGVAAAALAMNGSALKSTIIQAFLNRIDDDPLAPMVIVSACKDAASAKLILKRVTDKPPYSNKTLMRILLMSAQNTELHEQIRIVMNQYGTSISENLKDSVAALTEILGRTSPIRTRA